jgi:plastocyanin
MLDKIWTGILDFTSKLVIPDWGALVNLIPVAIAALVVLWLLLTVRRFATMGPTTRGRSRITPLPPPGIHAPGPSYAPVFAAVGLFALLAGLVFGGLLVPIGGVVFVLSLLYWGREGLAEYDHLSGADRLPAVVVAPREPPPGVHMPGPSFRPILASLALAILFLGLVFGGWLVAVGIISLAVALIGWLGDARAEYRKAVEADATGHLEALPAPSWPKRVLGVMGVLLVIALILNAGILPPKAPAAASGPGASGAPAGSGAAPGSGGPGGSGAPGASGGPAGAVSIVAQNVKFTTTDVAAPANKDFTINFDNKDPSTPHDVDILASDGSHLFDGQVVTGPKQVTYQVKALAPGSYKFICSIHPTLMTGTIKIG